MGRSEAVRKSSHARVKFCGMGTRRVKIRLNRLSRTSAVARAFRIALEIEDCSTLGKKYGGSWSYTYYEKKHQFIHELIILFVAHGWTYGKHQSDAFHTRWIIYFELPGCEQISFHTNLDCEVPDYPREWDGKVHSTLNKLEAAISNFLNPENNSLTVMLEASVPLSETVNK